MRDDRGNELLIGDIVRMTGWDSDRGGHLYLMQADMTVVGLARTRVILIGQFRGQVRVGNELLRVRVPIDGRPLVTNDEAWTNERAKIGAP